MRSFPKVALVTGSYPPARCGVGDYAEQLFRALTVRGYAVEVVTGTDWSLAGAPALARLVRSLGADLVHFQYPTIGFGSSLGPQALAPIAPVPVVTTLHEFSAAHALRKAALLPFATCSAQFVFTSEYERAAASRWYPWVRGRSAVVPIGSNVPFRSGAYKDGRCVAYVGMIRPGKGVDGFLRLAGACRDAGAPFRFRVFGSPDPRTMAYYEELRASELGTLAEWNVGLSHEALSDALASCTYAYLPFPDGASERRGSLLAALGNSVAVLTTRGEHTPKILDGAVYFTTGLSDALDGLMSMHAHAAARERIVARGCAYASHFEWGAIAAAHDPVYEAALRRSFVVRGGKSVTVCDVAASRLARSGQGNFR